jgi:hypothetical protein
MEMKTKTIFEKYYSIFWQGKKSAGSKHKKK